MRNVGPLPETIAGVDLGSNSFHLIVARPESDSWIVLDRLREMVRLAGGLDSERRIRKESQQLALDCLHRFGQRLRHIPSDAVRAVGTNTLRSARHTEDFLKRAEQALGHPIETISGMEEARLIYLGVAQSLANRQSRRLVVDIGGGSTELIVGEHFLPLRMDSFYMGCVATSRAWFPGGEISLARWNRAEMAALQELEPVQSIYRALEWDEAVGASGTIRSVASVARAAGWTKQGVTLKALRRIRDAVIKAGSSDRLALDGLNPARQSVFVGGLVVLMAVFEALGVERMLLSEGALREGLLYDLLGRIREEDVRSRSVSALADRCHVDRKQASRVECTAFQLFDQVATDWELSGPEDRRLLGWAAQLHEIGLDVAHQHYHKHGEYIVAESDLYGFSREQQRMLATLVRAHRRKFPAAALKRLPRRRRTVERLAVLLRVAALLHRSRDPGRMPEPELRAGKRRLRIDFDRDWLERHPLTRADLEQERVFLENAGYALEAATT